MGDIESVGGGEFHLVFAAFYHPPCEDVGEWVVSDTEHFLHMGNDRGSGELGGALVRIPCVALVLALEEHASSTGDVRDFEIGNAATSAAHDCLPIADDGHVGLPLGVIPDIGAGGCCRLFVHGRIELACIVKVHELQIGRFINDLVLERIGLIQVVANHYRGSLFCESTTLLSHTLPVRPACKIVESHDLYMNDYMPDP